MPTAGEDPSSSRESGRSSAFTYFWSAATLRAFGGAIAGVGFQVLIVTVLDATPIQISVLSALTVVPYLLFGFVVGALMDRWRRQRTLVFTSFARAAVFALLAGLVFTGWLEFWSLAAVVLTVGALTLFAESAAQPLLPRIVPRAQLVRSNSRLHQSETVAATGGPAVGGALISLVGPPLLFAIEAAINAVAGILQSRIKILEPRAERRMSPRGVGREVAEGMRYVYRHRTLRPQAISVHVWFLGHSIVTTVFSVYVLRQLDLPAWALGIAFAAAGVGGFLGALVAPAVGVWLGAGHAILLGRALAVIPWLVLGLLPLSDESGLVFVVVLASASQFVYGLSMGIEDTNDIAYRQAVAPDAIQGRMNSTIRTVNRTVFFFGAISAGALMVLLGYRMTLLVASIVFAAAAVVILFSALRTARHEDAQDPGSSP